MSDDPIYHTAYGAMILAHHVAELHNRLLGRVDDLESYDVMARALALVTEAERLLEERWAWSDKNPPAILRNDVG